MIIKKIALEDGAKESVKASRFFGIAVLACGDYRWEDVQLLVRR